MGNRGNSSLYLSFPVYTFILWPNPSITVLLVSWFRLPLEVMVAGAAAEGFTGGAFTVISIGECQLNS